MAMAEADAVPVRMSLAFSPSGEVPLPLPVSAPSGAIVKVTVPGGVMFARLLPLHVNVPLPIPLLTRAVNRIVDPPIPALPEPCPAWEKTEPE